MNIGITGYSGFIGTHLSNTLNLYSDKYNLIFCEDSFFDDKRLLENFVEQCDTIVHLAGVNRAETTEQVYDSNIKITDTLVKALNKTKATPHIIFTSSIQENSDSLYGKAKAEVRKMLADWADNNNAGFTGLVIPNTYGPYGKPFYNSVVATFCYQLTHDKNPKIKIDAELKMIYVQELISEIFSIIQHKKYAPKFDIQPTTQILVSEILEKLKDFKLTYFDKGIIPELKNQFEVNLFNTFRGFIDYQSLFPRKYTLHTDNRGSFVEIIKLGTGGQVSFSTTKADITRGNHFHTRKIERFAVIKGKALIQIRKIGTDDVLNFELSGEEPSYVDMPIWFTHNIKNTGTDDLYTMFWINEFYNPEDADTYFENV